MTRKNNIIFVLLFAVLIVSISSVSAFKYVRAGASGTGSGNDWTNAYTSLPASLTRGETYYIADGNYMGYKFDDPVNGSLWITIKKAISNGDHGTSTGWDSTYGDGQAVFDGANVAFVTSYYSLDGATRNESNWSESSKYGIRIRWVVDVSAADSPAGARNHLRFKYVDVGGADGNLAGGATYAAMYLMAGGSDYYIGYSHLHNVNAPAIKVGPVDNIILEYSYLGPAWSKETIRAGDAGNSNDWIIRYNQFVDGCQGTPGDSSATGCTADIAAFVGSFNNWSIYGNIFRESNHVSPVAGPVDHSDAIIEGNPATNFKVYNNIFYGFKSRGGLAKMSIYLVGSNNFAYNNIWYGIDSQASIGCTATVCSNNWCAGHAQCGNIGSNNVTGQDNPFVDISSRNFHLKDAASMIGPSPINRGINLGAGYSNIDMDGNLRGGDGVWDIGTFEFNGVVAQVNGSCGVSNNVCNSGALNDILDNPTTYLWQCVGQGGGTTASCSQLIPPTNGQCSSSLNSCISPASATSISSNATANLWVCPGSNGGSNAQCFITIGANKFAIGDRVYVSDTTPLVIRSTAGGTNIGSQNPSALGTIAGGPTTASVGGTPYVWWNVTFDTSPSGWTIENFLEKYTLAASYHPADSNSNNILTAVEVGAYVNSYFSGSISLTEALYALTLLQSGGSYSVIGTSGCASAPWNCFSSN